jgi:hypothetical protein
MRSRILFLTLPSLLLASIAACGDDNPPAADGGADAATPDAGGPDAPPAVAPKLRNELDDVSDEALGLHALQLLGAPVEGAQQNCNSCHGMSRERIRSWADPINESAVPSCFTDLEVSTPAVAKQMIDCLRLDPNKATSPYQTHKLGIFASGVNLAWFEFLFERAYGQTGEQEWTTFKNAVLMPRPKSGHAPFSQADFDVVAEWFQRGLPQLDELLGDEPPPPDCTESISNEVATHTAAMVQSGWRALNAEHNLLMFGCAGASDPRDCLATYPRATETTFGASWEVVAGSKTRVLRTNHYQSSYWTRSSADGRFVAHGGGSNFGSTIIDLANDREIPVNASYDPGFFPDNSGFMFQGGGTGMCTTDLLTSEPDSISFNEPQCSEGISIGLYQHIGASLDGSDYWSINGDFVSDDGGHSATLEDPEAYFPSTDTVTLTPMINQGGHFEQGQSTELPSAYEGDTVISPSATLLITRVADPDGTNQQGMRLRKLVTHHTGNTTTAETPQIARYCTINGGKPAFSYDERFIVLHHYIGAEDAVDLGFTGASDPNFAPYLSQGASNLYLVELATGHKTRITNMKPGQYALFPHFRSDGWVYFMVRNANQSTEYVVASDAALVIAD